MFKVRSSGILLHPTSLPSKYGIGDLGSQAYEFIDFLGESGQQIWQILPLGPTGWGNSPYSSYSALAGNPLLISPEKLQEKGLLSEEDLEKLPEFPRDRVNYDLVRTTKMPLLQKAGENFKQREEWEQKEFLEFCESQADWLDDYGLFMAIKEANNGASWMHWDKAIATRQPEAIAQWNQRLTDQIFYHKFMQFEFFRQWKELKQYANEKGIKIFGDIPIYVAHDSVDVWANREIFCLDEATGAATLMAGVPPDYFSETGQLWGNPVYNWEKLEQDNFQWWVRRIQGMLEYVDIIRIDHFRGFEAYWAVPQGETTAMNGEWIEAPGEAFFTILLKELGELPIVAEDLGVITKEVEALRDKFEFPGMKILHFAFDSDRANPFLPFNYSNRNCVVYTGTHDNNTTLGWFEERSFVEKARVVNHLGGICPEGINWSLIRLALSSVANSAIFPLQDILGLSTWAKMNTPSTIEDNWSWRYRPEALTPDIAQHLKHLTYLYGRQPL
ncbi:MAG: 4-alpha-glucanotransferase [Gomphosphaeria aponina SAG 52.96 = DSM 107014]|uniref:4-alpha-glucanotransferase n=1 Tax=Gomphosphaeria aponina SAG 52.96 = DSM 107014 TaxID=1521640 RepID=A0A941GWJ4_9CHRO|nr:4-alpha-glucanotransferase [Gomphosphaeria aponina SAG 52.96 = DSM 107014]